MRIPLSRESQLPLYQQIEAYLRAEILSGALPADSRLPSTRQLAHDLGVNRITVSNAYAELEAVGLVYSKLGSGTFVAPEVSATAASNHDGSSSTNWPIWQKTVLERSRLPTRQVMNQIILDPVPPQDTISFWSGVGEEQLFPADDFRKAIQKVLRQDKHEALGYGDRAGYLPLRATIAHILASQGIHTHPENVLITSGSQQAMALIADLTLRPGDTVLLESPTYSGAIDLFSSLGVHLVGIAVDRQGMRVELVEQLLRTHHPSLIHTIPTFQNPTGACMSGERRRQLVALADRYNVPILEDEFVGDLRYEGRAQPALKALDPGGRVFYMGTFSKMLMPGLRVGYIVVDGPVYERLVDWKHIHDLATSNLIQRALEAYISVGRYQTHLNRARRVYRQRRDAMLAALEQLMPPDTHWTPAQGGFFIWMRLPGGIPAQDLLPLAAREQVNFAPGCMFYPGEKEHAYIRLNFAMNPPDRIHEGIRRLAGAVQRYRTLQ